MSEPNAAPGLATRRYKEIVAGITAAADELRDRDRERAVALSRRLVGLEAAMQRAVEQDALTRLGVELQWEAALETLWVESWMQLRPRPAPDPTADATDVPALDQAVADAAAELREAVRRRRFGLPRR